MTKSIITVTGGTGYIASWIVKDLLEGGHEVRITVRDQQKKDKYQHLLDVAKSATGELKVYEADLLLEGSFDEAVEGADYVMHTASPFFLDGAGDPQKNLVDPAVKGTQNVLDSVNKTLSIKRVILTSSVAAIYGDNIDLTNSGASVLDEGMWNTSSSLDHGPYSYSKTQAEKSAWSMCEAQKRWDMVTIHPGFVLGPSLTKRNDSTSIGTMLRLLHGELAIGSPDLKFVFSDVRDVAKGHLLAAFIPEAKGRYIIAEAQGGLIDLGRIIAAKYGKTYKVPKRLLPNWLVWLLAPTIGFTRSYTKKNLGYPLAVNNRKSVNELGMTYHRLRETVEDHVAQLLKDGLV